MDPNAALSYALEAIAQKEWSNAHEHLTSLLEWIDNGGFVPQVGAFTSWGSTVLYHQLKEMVESQMESSK